VNKLNPDQQTINQTLDKLDVVLKDMACRWGAGRIETLVSKDMADKWQRQRLLLNQAVRDNELGSITNIVEGTIRGCAALEQNAIEQGHKPIAVPTHFTAAMPDGSTLVIVHHHKDAASVEATLQGITVVWTADELARLIWAKATLVNPQPDGRAQQESTKNANFDFAVGDDIPF